MAHTAPSSLLPPRHPHPQPASSRKHSRPAWAHRRSTARQLQGMPFAPALKARFIADHPARETGWPARGVSSGRRLAASRPHVLPRPPWVQILALLLPEAGTPPPPCLSLCLVCEMRIMGNGAPRCTGSWRGRREMLPRCPARSPTSAAAAGEEGEVRKGGAARPGRALGAVGSPESRGQGTNTRAPRRALPHHRTHTHARPCGGMLSHTRKHLHTQARAQTQTLRRPPHRWMPPPATLRLRSLSKPPAPEGHSFPSPSFRNSRGEGGLPRQRKQLRPSHLGHKGQGPPRPLCATGAPWRPTGQ